jgi:phage tail-like protein
MDVNGTRFHLLLGRENWESCTDGSGQQLGALWSEPADGQTTPVAWSAERNELTLLPEVFQFPASALEPPPQLADRRGGGRDAFGNWYWVAADAASLLVASIGDGSTARYWPAIAPTTPAPQFGGFAASDPQPPPAPQALCGAAVTEDQFLVVGTIAPAGLLAFDLQTGGPPMHLPWPASIPFAPLDMAARPGGGVFILDAENGCVWELDRHLHILPQTASGDPLPAPAFVALDGSSPQAGALSEPSTGWATAVDGEPIAVEAAPGGGFLILDRNVAGACSLVRAYRDGAVLGAAAALNDSALALDVVAYDFALVESTLFVVDASGKQAYAFTLAIESGPALTLTLLPSFYPMRLFGGKGLLAAGGQAYYDFAEGWIQLVCQPRPRYAQAGTVVTPVFDGAEPGCVWHRLLFDGLVPSASAIAVSSIAADDIATLAAGQWLAEPDPQQRSDGSEIPYSETGPYQTYELLFQQARGRYLQVRLELLGDGRSTPRLRALRAWYPRFSYLRRYLPAAYGEEPISASFLDRYLANVEGICTTIEERIAEAQVLMRPQSAPAEALEWLAGWLGLALDPMWDERRRRLLMANAMTFFAARGTIRGVAIALRFVLDACVEASVFSEQAPSSLATARVIEAYRTRSTPGVVFGDPTELVPGTTLAPGSRWNPTEGRDALNGAYGSYLESAGLGAREYPVVDPADATSAAWQAFSSAVLGFVPTAPDPARWEAFLDRRYSNPSVALDAYGLTGEDTSSMPPPPRALPPNGPALVDWFQFEAVVVPMTQRAHRFTVLVPWPLEVADPSGQLLGQEQLSALTTRVVELQQPAHTTFDVKFFWAAFRVGEARIGEDTLLATGSRAPELIAPAVLGGGYLGASELGGRAPSDAIARSESTTPTPETEPR